MKHLLTLAMVAALTTVSLAQTQTAKPTAAATKPDQAKTLAMLQGAWLFTSINDQDAANGPEIIVTITGDKYVQTVEGTIVEKGSFKFDDTKKPMAMDLLIAEAVQDPDTVGKTQLGVFEVTATTMRGKLNDAGETLRPTDFTVADGFFVFTAKKK